MTIRELEARLIELEKSVARMKDKMHDYFETRAESYTNYQKAYGLYKDEITELHKKIQEIKTVDREVLDFISSLKKAARELVREPEEDSDYT